MNPSTRFRATSLLADDGAQPALTTAERGIANPLNEELWQAALEAEARLGVRSAVEARYGALREMLVERLGLEQSGEMRSLFRQLLGQT